MRFDIEGFVTFDTENASLVNLLTGDSIELSQTSNRLLKELLFHRGDILSRGEIFQSVFDRFGARASNSNLNQYISTLRKGLSELGIEKDVIITVPRVGFRISDTVLITSDSEYQTPVYENVNLEDKKDKNGYSFYLIILMVLFLMVALASLIVIAIEKVTPDLFLQKFIQDKCVFYMPSSQTLDELSNEFGMTHQFDCTTTKELHIYKQIVNSRLGINRQLLIIECDINKNKCKSYYVREKKNA
ncbi:winged helix-turn-helix domain-containing protein [Enterobacteriaceae bacterium G50]|nr:winged helix-turn-helix domain-containing protein [Enterobacteriaceae bacterium G50]